MVQYPLEIYLIFTIYQNYTLALTLIPLGYFEDLSPLGGGGGGAVLAPPQISATNGPIDLKIGTVVKQVK